ncbi:hypothetical protein EMIT0P265_170005 [Pseudomonas zeae]
MSISVSTRVAGAERGARFGVARSMGLGEGGNGEGSGVSIQSGLGAERLQLRGASVAKTCELH